MGLLRQWFGYPDSGEPTLVEAWTAIGQRLGLTVSATDARVDARGTVRGRHVAVEVVGRDRPWRVLAGDTSPMRRPIHMYWSSSLRVSCHVPRHLQGHIRFITPTDYAGWQPDGPLNQGRTIEASSASLADVLPEPVRRWLLDRYLDIRLDVEGDAVAFVETDKGADRRGGWFVGVPIHNNYPGTGYEWPERAVVGPVWWVNMLCDIAEAVERST